MNKLLLAVVCVLGMSGFVSAQDIVVEREVELKSDFTKVAGFVLGNADFLNKATGTKIVERKVEQMGFTVKPGKGLIVYVVHRNKMEIRNETLWYKSHLVFNKKSLVISSSLDEDSRCFHHNDFLMEVHKKGNGTFVRIKLDFSVKGEGGFLARVVARTRLARIEKALRKLIDEPLEKIPENE